MRFHIDYILICLIFSCAEATNHHDEKSWTGSEKLPATIKTLEPVNRHESVAKNRLFLLIPSNSSLTDVINLHSDFSLFKLNTDFRIDDGDIRGKRSVQEADSPSSKRHTLESARTARKINLFLNLLYKQKQSPLYLVNGTVCRFISTGPICTFVSTNGLPGLNQPQQQQQQFQNQGQFNNNNQQQQGFNTNSRQQQPSFNSNQQLRPAGLVDDDIPDINVSKINKDASSAGSKVAKQQLSNTATLFSGPTNHRSRSRPLNLLSLSKPMRQFISGPTNLALFSRRNQNPRGARKD